MIAIVVVFGVISYVEWKYLKRNKRSLRTQSIIMGLAFFLLIASEALFLVRDHWSLGMFLNSIFEPIQNLLTIES